MSKKKQGPRVLLLDIETKPILAHVWKIWDENVALNQIKSDWSVLSWAAKWLDDPPSKVLYADNRAAKDLDDDKALLKSLWKLLNEADVVISHNGKRFDVPKLNARFVLHGFQPPSPFKQIDTLALAKKQFSFTSNRLEYLTDKLCVKYKKLSHPKFAGFELWKQCMAGNKKAWQEMKVYNIHDVLALEELYQKLIPWSDDAPNFNLYVDDESATCKCGSETLQKRGYHYTTTGKFQRYQCQECGAWSRGRENKFSKEKRKSLRLGVPR